MTVNALKQRIDSKTSEGGDGSRLLVLGGGFVGQSIGESLADRAHVTLVDDSDVVCRRAADALDETYCGNPATAEVLAAVDAGDADAAVVASLGDTRTFLAIQLLRTRFGVDTVVACVNDPELADVVADRCDAVVTAAPILATELVAAYEDAVVPKARW